ncbi:hypothetical protein AB0E78_41490 [Streptomyces sp. NPDC032198]|uniref:hypothetical protein n=1 Tax=Streptomyces sp. NPDC032198 TaxID=3155127 RepID=UPI0033ECC515
MPASAERLSELLARRARGGVTGRTGLCADDVFPRVGRQPKIALRLVHLPLCCLMLLGRESLFGLRGPVQQRIVQQSAEIPVQGGSGTLSLWKLVASMTNSLGPGTPASWRRAR